MSSLISVVVPTYRVEPYIEQCIESILNQTHSDIELLLLEHDSPDNSLEICRKWAEKDGRARILHVPDKGVSAARNFGIQNANGTYICFVDGDDWIEPEMCEESLKAIEQYDADLVMWSYIREYETRSAEKNIFDKDIIFNRDQVQSLLRRRIIGLLGEELRDPKVADSLSPVWGKLYRTEIAKRVEFVDLDRIGTNEDGLFNLDYMKQTKCAVFLNRHWYHYRKGAGNTITSRFQENRIEKWGCMLEEIRSRIDPENEAEKQALRNRICLSMIGQSLNVARCDTTAVEKRKMLSAILNQEAYKDAFRHFDLQYFQPHWKLFFSCCRRRQAVSVLGLAESMLRLKRIAG